MIKVAVNHRSSDGQCEMISCKGKRRAAKHVTRKLVKYDGAGNRLIGGCGGSKSLFKLGAGHGGSLNTKLLGDQIYNPSSLLRYRRKLITTIVTPLTAPSPQLPTHRVSTIAEG